MTTPDYTQVSPTFPPPASPPATAAPAGDGIPDSPSSSWTADDAEGGDNDDNGGDGEDSNEADNAADEEDASDDGSFYPDSQGRYHCICRLTSVRECGKAISELDLRLLDLEDSIGTVA